MMLSSEKNAKKYQYSSEFGLYRYQDCDNDYYTIKKNRAGFGYTVVLLTTIVLLFSICVIIYNYVSRTNSVLIQPIQKLNDSESVLKNNTNINIFNTSYSKEKINGKENKSNVLKRDFHVNGAEHLKQQMSEFNSINKNRRKITEIKEPRPFLYEIRDPKPSAFKPAITYNHKNHQVQSYGHQNKAKNIQEIIKYLTEQRPINELSDANSDNSKRLNIRGIYRQSHPSFYMKTNALDSQKRNNYISFITDPFFPYKPQNPSDVNLLAMDSFRFAPSYQLEPKKPQATEAHKDHDSSKLKKIKKQTNPMSVTLDIIPTEHAYMESIKQRKIRNFHPALYNPYAFNGYRNLYNQYKYFNQMGRYQQDSSGSNTYNPNIFYKQQKLKNNLHETRNEHPNKMVIHLNLYPRKKSTSQAEKDDTSNNVHQYNCTPEYDNKITQITNATEFNELLQNIRHFSNDQSNINKNPCQIEQNLYNLKIPEYNVKYMKKNPQEIEVVKSIGFTILNPYQPDEYTELKQNQWIPEIRQNHFLLNNHSDILHADQIPFENYNKINEAHEELYDESNENNNNHGETVKISLPYQNFKQKSVLTHNDWNGELLQKNPNLINHKLEFSGTNEN